MPHQYQYLDQPETSATMGVAVDSLADIPAAVWSTATAAGMFTGLFWMLATGRLYTGASHREIVRDKNEQLSDLREANDRMLNALQDLTVTAHTGPIALRSIAKEAQKAGDE